MKMKNLNGLWTIFCVFLVFLFASEVVCAYTLSNGILYCGNSTMNASEICDDCELALNNNSYTIVYLNESISNHDGHCIDNPSNFNNKTFDCQGNTIDGIDGNYWGIHIRTKSNVTVKNCIITDFDVGVGLYIQSHNITVTNNSISSCRIGLAANSVNNSNITNNTIQNNTQEGLYIGSSTELNIFNLNTVCYNNQSGGNYYDIKNETTYPGTNSGDNNTCDTTYSWNDASVPAGTTGCRYVCTASLRETSPIAGQHRNNVSGTLPTITTNPGAEKDCTLDSVGWWAHNSTGNVTGNYTLNSTGDYDDTWDDNHLVVDGYYNITIWMNDSCGNVDSATIEIYIDNTNPICVCYTPDDDNTTIVYGSIDLNCTCTDSGGLMDTLLNLTCGGTDYFSQYNTSLAGTSFTWSDTVDLSSAPGGTCWLNANASDDLVDGSPYLDLDKLKKGVQNYSFSNDFTDIDLFMYVSERKLLKPIDVADFDSDAIWNVEYTHLKISANFTSPKSETMLVMEFVADKIVNREPVSGVAGHLVFGETLGRKVAFDVRKAKESGYNHSVECLNSTFCRVYLFNDTKFTKNSFVVIDPTLSGLNQVDTLRSFTNENCSCVNCSDCMDKLNDASCTTVKLTTDITDYKDCCICNPANFSNKVFDGQNYTIDGDYSWLAGERNEDGLVLYMHFNNDSTYGENDTHFYDFSTTGNNGSCSGANCPSFTSSGKYSGAVDLDGTDDYVDCGNDSSLTPSTEISIEAWIKTDTVASGLAYIVDRSPGNDGYGLRRDADDVNFFVYSNDVPGQATAIDILNTTDWFHIVGIHNTTSNRIYINGVLKATTNYDASSGIDDPSANNLMIGQATQGGNFFNGTIDEVRIYNRSLTADEVYSNYIGSAGIHLNNRNNITIQYCNITEFITGVFVNVTNSTINSNTLCDNTLGINASESSGTTGENNTCNTAYNWNDTGTFGCTSVCSGYSVLVYLNTPANASATSDTTPDFNFTVQGDSNIYDCELFLNDTGYGTGTVNNNTEATITANASLSDGNYTWIVNCTYDGVTNQSNETWDLMIDSTAPVLSNVKFFALNSTKDVIGNETAFNFTNLADIEYMLINFTLTDTNEININITLWFTANGTGACAIGNNQSATCYNWSSGKWIEYKNGTDTSTFRDVDGVAIVDVVNCTYVGTTTERNYTCIIRQHYSPNLWKYYPLNDSDDKWQTGVNQRIKKNTICKFDLGINNIPLNSNEYLLSFWVNDTNDPAQPVLVYLCNSSYSTGDPSLLPECVLVAESLPSQFYEGGLLFVGVFTSSLTSNMGDMKYVMIETDSPTAAYYTLRTFKYLGNGSVRTSFSNNGGNSYTNLTDGYEVGLSLKWFYNGTGSDITQFVMKVYGNDSLGNDGNSSEQVMSWIATQPNNPPVIDIIVPAIGSNVSGNVSINWTTVDPEGDNFVTNITIENSTLTTVIAINLAGSVSNYDWNTTTYANGNYNVTVKSCENETADKYCINDSHEVTVINCNCSTCSECIIKLNSALCSEVWLNTNITNHSGNCVDNPSNFNNKTFDCQGYTIDGDGTGYGIYLDTKTNNTIKNCVVTEFSDGIELQTVTNSILTNNTANDNTYDGIYLESSLNNTLTNNTANNNGDNGIYLTSSLNNTLINNTFNDNNDGIYLEASSNNTLTSNTLSKNYDNGIYIEFGSNYNILTNNTVNNTVSYGIYLYNSADNNTLNSNQLCNNTVYDIFIESSSGNTGDNNTCDIWNNWNDTGGYGCTYACDACRCHTCDMCEASLNNPSCTYVNLTQDTEPDYTTTCINNPANFSNKTFDCRGYTIDGNDSGDGIYLNQKDNNTIKNCVITDFEDGIHIIDSSNSAITNNTINSNLQNGILISELSSDNTIINNTANDNQRCGLYIVHEDCTGNTINSNTFCSNGDGVTYFDIYDVNSNSGDNNTCNTTSNWNDTYSRNTGCKYACSGCKVTLFAPANASRGISSEINYTWDVTSKDNAWVYCNLTSGGSVINSTINSTVETNTSSYHTGHSGIYEWNVSCWLGDDNGTSETWEFTVSGYPSITNFDMTPNETKLQINEEYTFVTNATIVNGDSYTVNVELIIPSGLSYALTYGSSLSVSKGNLSNNTNTNETWRLKFSSEGIHTIIANWSSISNYTTQNMTIIIETAETVPTHDNGAPSDDDEEEPEEIIDVIPIDVGFGGGDWNRQEIVEEVLINNIKEKVFGMEYNFTILPDIDLRFRVYPGSEQHPFTPLGDICNIEKKKFESGRIYVNNRGSVGLNFTSRFECSDVAGEKCMINWCQITRNKGLYLTPSDFDWVEVECYKPVMNETGRYSVSMVTCGYYNTTVWRCHGTLFEMNVVECEECEKGDIFCGIRNFLRVGLINQIFAGIVPLSLIIFGGFLWYMKGDEEKKKKENLVSALKYGSMGLWFCSAIILIIYALLMLQIKGSL